MQKIKINDFFAFPQDLDLEPYLHKSLKEKKENSQYSLGGVVIHLGIADAGHYYSLIRDRGTG
jgi:ubiquitin C-terminal hydrolase